MKPEHELQEYVSYLERKRVRKVYLLYLIAMYNAYFAVFYSRDIIALIGG